MSHNPTAVLTLLVVLIAGCDRHGPAADAPVSGTLHINFRDNPAYTEFFRLENEGNAPQFTADAQGLRIAVPQGTTGEPVGLALKRSLRGDFGIRVGYELLK